jgi:uncharacterized protein (DUF427 family)
MSASEESRPAVSVEPYAGRVRVLFAGEVIADTTAALTLHERGHDPKMYVPLTDVRSDVLRESTTSTYCPRKGTARYWTIVVDGRVSVDALWGYPRVIDGCPDITAHVSFYPSRVDGIEAVVDDALAREH